MKKKTRTMKNFGKFNGSINKGTVILRSANMLIREFALVILSYLRVISSSDCQWSNFVEFWSDVICSIENYKTVNFHRVLDNNKRSTLIIPRCFDAFTHQVVRKCRTTIVSTTFMSQDTENASFVDSDQVIRRDVERSSIWKMRSSDTFPSRAMPAVTDKIPIRRNQNVYRQNTWNVQVLLANDVRSFDLISKEDSTFAWNSRDRFIVLIARQKEYGRQHESNLTIDNILKTLWYERKVHNIFVSEMLLVNDSALIDRAVYTYNPFAKINESAWGKTEIIDVKTVEQASNALSDLTYRSTKNLNGYELKVGILEKNRSVTTENPVEAYNTLRKYIDVFKGFDEIMLNTMARCMNFKVKRVYPKDRRFGYQLPNGTYVGAIGDVAYGRADVCFESLFVKTYGANVDGIEFTTHVEFDRVCIFVPKASKIPKWLRIYHFFPPSIWICSIASHVLTYVTWHFLQIFAPKRKEKINFLTTVYRSFLFNVGCPVKLPDRSAERVLLTGVFFASITITGIFNGILYNSFANDMFYQDIDDLEDLDASGLPIIFTSFSVNDIFGSRRDADASQLIQNLRKKLLYGKHALNTAAYCRNVSGLVRAHHFPIMRAEYVDSDGAPLLHLIKECPGTYYLSYLLPKNSILRGRINVLISRLNQAGLPTLWSSRNIRNIIARKKLIAKQNRPPIEKKANPFVPFKLSDMQTSFYMLLVGLSISTLIFFYETGWLKTPSLRNEKFKSK